jgi:hypothetical protein
MTTFSAHRMGRILRPLLYAVVGIWLVGFLRSDELWVFPGGTHALAAKNIQGSLALMWAHLRSVPKTYFLHRVDPFGGNELTYPEFMPIPLSHVSGVPSRSFTRYVSFGGVIIQTGHNIRRTSAGSTTGPTDSFAISLPLWPAVLLISAAAYLSARRVRRISERRRKGLCLNCGYDLRYAQLRCPECGTPTSESANAERTDTKPTSGAE